MKSYFGITVRIVAALSLSLFLVGTVSTDASATRGGRNHKVTICHATNSHKNPYVAITVDKSSIDEPNNHGNNGHGDHTGTIWHQGVADHSWGDIIPVFTNDAGDTFPGLNWTTEGKAIYNNDCKTPKVQGDHTPKPPKDNDCEPKPHTPPVVTPPTTPPVTTPVVTPPSTGQILAASTTKPTPKGQVLPSNLPSTGGISTPNAFIILIVALSTYFVAYWLNKKKTEA